MGLELRHYIDSMSPMPSLIFVSLFLSAAFALAGSEPYGKSFVEVDGLWPDESLPEAPLYLPENPAAARAAVDQLEQRLAEQQFSVGPYASALAETLGDLARAQEAAGDVEAAMRSRERALHLTRVNDGLYSEAQGPLVRAILDTLRREKDFARLDERYDYFFRLYGAAQPPWDGVRWPAAMEYLRWQREALRRELEADPLNRLLQLQILNDDLLDRLNDPESAAGWELRRDATLSQLKTFYLIEELVDPAPVFPTRRGDWMRPDDPRRDLNINRERLENLQRTLSGSARRMLEELVTVIPEDLPAERAAVRLALADWLQWHGSTREARALYEQLWDDLNQQGLESLASEWFSRPVPLPDNGVFWVPDAPGAGPIRVGLRVSESGRARADIERVPPRLSRAASRLRKHINAARFRPAIVDGEARDWESPNAVFLIYWP